MSTKPPKRNLFRLNRFQKPIVDLILFPFLLIFSILFLNIALFYYEIKKQVYPDFLDVHVLSERFIAAAVVLWLTSLFVIVWAHRASNRVVGPFERILRELDEVIEKKLKKHITARQGDDLAAELLKRINILIDRSH